MRERAFTLIELMLTVAVLATAAVVLLPAATPTDRAQQVDLAAAEVAAALRFARGEALRTQRWHGVRLSASSERIRVFSLDTASTPPVETFDVRHPIDKKIYDIALASGSFSRGVDLERAEFRSGGVSTKYETIAFSRDGVPASSLDLTLLDDGRVDLAYRGQSRRVDVTPTTGRVTVQ